MSFDLDRRAVRASLAVLAILAYTAPVVAFGATALNHPTGQPRSVDWSLVILFFAANGLLIGFVRPDVLFATWIVAWGLAFWAAGPSTRSGSDPDPGGLLLVLGAIFSAGLLSFGIGIAMSLRRRPRMTGDALANVVALAFFVVLVLPLSGLRGESGAQLTVLAAFAIVPHVVIVRMCSASTIAITWSLTWVTVIALTDATPGSLILCACSAGFFAAAKGINSIRREVDDPNDPGASNALASMNRQHDGVPPV